MQNTKATDAKRDKLQIGILLLLPSLIWSTVFPFSKLVLEFIPPTSLAALRFSIGACFLTAYALRNAGRRKFIAAWQNQGRRLLALGFFGVFLHNLLQNLGLNLSSASSTSLLGAMDPIFTMVLSIIFLKEKANTKKLVALLMAVLGIYLVTSGGHWALDWGKSSLGNVLALGSALCYSLYTIMSKQVLNAEEPPTVVAWSTIVGAVLLVLVALFTERAVPWSNLPTPLIFNVLYLSIVPTSVSVVAYAYLLQRVQASLAALSLFLIPVFSILWSVFLLSEQLGWPIFMGGALIICGVALAVRGSRAA